MSTVVEAEAKLTAQNQISIPAPIRKALGIQAGKSRVLFQVLDGKVIVSAAKPKSAPKEDPALLPFLALLEKDMRTQPKRIKPLPIGLLAKARALVKGVEVDLDGPLTGQD